MLQGTTTTPSPFVPPTREELKVKYGIPNDDFVILIGTTSPPCIPDKHFVLKAVGSAMGVPVWLLSSPAGRVAFVVLSPLWVPGAVERIDSVCTLLSFPSLVSYASTLNKETKLQYVLTTPAPILPEQIQRLQELGEFPIDSVLCPIDPATVTTGIE